MPGNAAIVRRGYEALDRGDTELKRVLIDEDGRVIGVDRNVADRDGKHLDVYCCIVFELENGRIVDGREHVHDLRAWEEFWS